MGQERTSAYVTARARLQAAREQARLDAINTFAVHAERYVASRGSRPKAASGTRIVHLPPAFFPLLRAHLLAHTAPGADGLLFSGDRKDHMSARYLLNRYAVARKAAGRPDLTIHGLRHWPSPLAGQHGATSAELQARAGHASQAATAIYRSMPGRGVNRC